MIGLIASLISITGLIFLALLLWEIHLKSQERHLKKHRQRFAGLADLLNYAAVVDDGVIVGKNGSFMVAWLYQGEDNANTTDEAREMVSFRINQALSAMGNGWMVHVDAVRRAAPGYSERGLSHFQDSISMAVDEERRQLFESMGTLYEGYFVITLTWYPPILAQKRFVELMFDDTGVRLTQKAKTKQLIDEFKQSCRNFESRMSSALHLERLNSEKQEDNFLRYLQFCITGLNHPVNLPKNPIYLDALIGGQEFTSGITPRIGRKFIQCVAIEGFPLESYPGILTALSQLPIEYRWSSRFIFLEPHQAVAHFTKYSKKWRQKIRGFFDQVFKNNSGQIDEDALDMVKDAQSAIAETNSGMVGQGYFTSVVVLMDEDRALTEKAALFIEKNINALGFTARTETINTMEAFMGSLPGHGCDINGF